jgi:hypothetical protein
MAGCLDDWKGKYLQDQVGSVKPQYIVFQQPENNIMNANGNGGFHYKAVLLKETRRHHRKNSSDTEHFEKKNSTTLTITRKEQLR